MEKGKFLTNMMSKALETLILYYPLTSKPLQTHQQLMAYNYKYPVRLQNQFLTRHLSRSYSTYNSNTMIFIPSLTQLVILSQFWNGNTLGAFHLEIVLTGKSPELFSHLKIQRWYPSMIKWRKYGMECTVKLKVNS